MRASLARRATELAGAGPGAVEVERVCDELGLPLRIEPADGRRRGCLVHRDGGWEVVVFRARRSGPDLAPHERFTVAHEIGHHVLMEESGFTARRRREYWEGEELCQHFASCLLLPERLIGPPMGSPPGTQALMAAVNDLACRAGVSAEPAARALVSRSSAPVALGTFLLDPNPATRRLGFRGWWVENRAWWGGRGGRRLAVYVDHPLAPALEIMRQLRAGQFAAPSLEGAARTTLRRRRGTGASFAALLT